MSPAHLLMLKENVNCARQKCLGIMRNQRTSHLHQKRLVSLPKCSVITWLRSKKTPEPQTIVLTCSCPASIQRWLFENGFCSVEEERWPQKKRRKNLHAGVHCDEKQSSWCFSTREKNSGIRKDPESEMFFQTNRDCWETERAFLITKASVMSLRLSLNSTENISLRVISWPGAIASTGRWGGWMWHPSCMITNMAETISAARWDNLFLILFSLCRGHMNQVTRSHSTSGCHCVSCGCTNAVFYLVLRRRFRVTATCLNIYILLKDWKDAEELVRWCFVKKCFVRNASHCNCWFMSRFWGSKNSRRLSFKWHPHKSLGKASWWKRFSVGWKKKQFQHWLEKKTNLKKLKLLKQSFEHCWFLRLGLDWSAKTE